MREKGMLCAQGNKSDTIEGLYPCGKGLEGSNALVLGSHNVESHPISVT